MIGDILNKVTGSGGIGSAFAGGVPLTTSELIAVAGSQLGVKSLRERLEVEGKSEDEIQKILDNQAAESLEKVRNGELIPAVRNHGRRETLAGD